MNKIYRVVWNKATQTWAAVCEYAKAQGKSSGSDVVGEMSDKRMGGRFAYTMVMSGLLIATGQVAYAATVADGTGLNAIVIQGASSTATATGADSLAAGTNAAADGNSALAIGTDSKATGAYATAVGANVTAGGLNSITIGRSNNVTGRYTTVIGSGNIPKDGKGLDAAGGIVDVKAADTITATHSSIIGKSNQIAVSSVIGTPPPYAAVLTDVQVQGNDNIINRGHAYVFGSNNTINTDASNMELESVVAVGRQNTVSGNNSLAVGRLNTVAGDSALAVGINSQALGRDGIAIGNKAYANRGENPVALGGLTHAGQFGTALGARTSVEGDQGLAAATGAVVKGARAVAVGSYSFAGPEDAVALGHNTAATGSRAVAMGAGSVVSGARSGAWGIATNGGQPQNNTTDRSFVGGADSYAIGNKNIIGDKSSDSFVLGNNVKLGATGASIAITNVAGRDGTTNASTRTNAVTYTGATAITGAVALGSDTSVTVDNGVALGKGSVASTAAGQAGTDPLSAKDATASAGVWTATHAAVSVGNGTTVTRQITSVAAGTQDTDAVNVAQLKAAGFTLATSASAGEVQDDTTDVTTKKVKNGETVTVDAGKNIKVTQDGKKVSIATKDEVEFTQITLGDSTNNTVLTSTTDGLDVGGDKITNVANGDVSATSKDAINGSQLFGTANSVATALGGGATVQADGTVSAPTYNITNPADGTVITANNVGDALKGLNDAVNSPLTFVGDSGNFTRNLGQTTTVKGGITDTAKLSDNNIGVVAKDGTLDIKLAKDIALDSVTTGNTLVDNNGITIKAPTGGTTTDVKLTAGGLDNGGNKITNVANGDITSTSKDAINGSQLRNTAGDIAGIIGGNATVDNAGNVTASNIGGTTATTIDDAIKTVKTTVKSTDNTIKVTANTANANDGTVFDISVDAQKLAESAQLPVVYTKADGTKVYKVGNSFFDNKEGTGTAIDATDVIASMQNADGTTSTATKLANIAKGDVSSNSKDAINGSQLFAQGEGVKNIIGGNTTYNPSTGAYENNDIGGTGKGNINDAIQTVNTKADANATEIAKGLNFGANDQTATAGDAIKRQLGETIGIKGGITDTSTATSGENVITRTDANGNINIELAKNAKFDSVTTGNTLVDNSGITIKVPTGGTTSDVKLTAGGLDNGGNKITNVAPGEISATSKDAINGSQLYNVQKAAVAAKTEVKAADGDKNVSVTSATADDGHTIYSVGVSRGLNVDSVTLPNADGSSTNLTAGGLSFKDADGNATGPSVTANGIDAGDKQITDVASGLGGQKLEDVTGDDLKNAVNVGDLQTVVQDINTDINAAKSKVEAGKNVTVSSVSGPDGTVYTVATKDEVDFNKVTVGGLTIDKDNVDVAGNTIISGVGAGEISSTSTDAVNGSQLYATNQKVTQNTTDITNINTTLDKGLNFSADSGTTVNRKLGDTVAITGDKSITTTTTANGVQIKLSDNIDVKNVNVSQSITVAEGAKVDMGGNTIQNVGAGVNGTDAVNVNQLNSVASNINNRIDDVADDANAGVSSAMAMAALPQAYIPGKSMLTGGIASYNGEGAVAVGFSKLSDNGRWVLKISGSADTEGNAGGAVGAGFHF